MQISGISGTSNSSSAGSQQTWTNQQVAQLRNLVNQGIPLDQIASKLNFSQSAIKIKAAALGLHLGSS